MDVNIEKIFLTVEHQELGEIDYGKEYTDVIVQLTDGRSYVASFFTFQSLEKINAMYKLSGEYLFGKFFWAEGMVLIDDCSGKSIELVVNYLIEEGDFFRVFRKM